MIDTAIKTNTLLWVEVASSPDREADKAEYIQKAGPLTVSYGGKPVKTFKVTNGLEHRHALQVAILYSFPNEQSIHDLFSDPDYIKLIPVREKAFSEIRYTIFEEIEG